jgi:beta-lactamase class D
MKYYILMIFAFCLLFLSCGRKSEVERFDLQQFYAEADAVGAFILYDTKSKKKVHFNPTRTQQRFTPYETFLLPFSLIALETGALASLNDTIKWNGTDHKDSLWNQDHDLLSAKLTKCKWYYKDIAIRIGNENMKLWLDTLSTFGNMVRAGGLSDFWYDGSFVVSTDEWFDFIMDYHNGELPFSAKSIEESKRLFDKSIRSEKVDEYKLIAFGDRNNVGWQIGIIENENSSILFINNVQFNTTTEEPEMAISQLTNEILIFLGL